MQGISLAREPLKQSHVQCSWLRIICHLKITADVPLDITRNWTDFNRETRWICEWWFGSSGFRPQQVLKTHMNLLHWCLSTSRPFSPEMFFLMNCGKKASNPIHAWFSTTCSASCILTKKPLHFPSAWLNLSAASFLTQGSPLTSLFLELLP